MKWLIILAMILSFAPSLLAQDNVEHNFEMEPQKTNCDELQLEHLSIEEQIIQVEHGIFRFSQDFKLNRVKGFQAAWYYSCDSKTGYLITKVDNKKDLYYSVPKQEWENFIASGDFINYIDKHFKIKD